MKYQISPTLRAVLRTLTDEERRIMRAKLKAERCTESFAYCLIDGIAWQLDGHHRREICNEEKITYDWKRIQGVTTISEAIAWIKSNQIGRRNISAEEASRLRQERVERVADARQDGQSIRTIADAEGKSTTTIQDDLKKAGVQGLTPEPPDGTITGRDQKKYTAGKPKSGRAKKVKPEGFDVKEWEKHVGYVVRGMDDLREAANAIKTPAFAGRVRQIDEVRPKLERVYEVCLSVAKSLKGHSHDAQ